MSGIRLEAQSVEDDTISFDVYIFNIQPGYELNYLTGALKSCPLMNQKRRTHAKKKSNIRRFSLYLGDEGAEKFTAIIDYLQDQDPHTGQN